MSAKCHLDFTGVNRRIVVHDVAVGAGGLVIEPVVSIVCIAKSQDVTEFMCNDLLTKPYLETGGDRQELAIDIENSTIVIVGLVPWAIACSVPLTFFGVGYGALPWSMYLYLIPLCYIFTKKRWFADRARAAKAPSDS